MIPRRAAPGPARPLGGIDQGEVLADPARRQPYVTALFDLIAPRYDDFTRWFSFGMDRAWKREMLALATAQDARVALDLACGTGDVAFGVAARAPGALVLGLDPSRAMLDVARGRGGGAGTWMCGDMLAIPLRDGRVDLVTASYGLRNAADVDASVAEIARVLRPGGRFVSLDFFRPESAAWRALFLGYLRVAGWLVGWLWHGEPDAYVYIPRSIDRFVSHRELARALEDAGFRVTAMRVKLLGGICIHCAELTDNN